MSPPDTAPLRKSDATKALILAAAREQFALHGYQAATIRGIAAAARIDPAMVMRYYGNKEGLFAAAAEFDLRLPDLSVLPRAEAGAAIVGHFLDRWEGDEALMALLRAAVNHEAAAGRMQAIFAGQVRPAVAKWRGDGGAGAAAAAGLIATQLLGLGLCRYVLKLPPVVGLKRADVLRRVGAVVQGYLEGE